MADIEKVLLALQCCYMEPDNCGQTKCPYYKMRHDNDEKECGEQLMEDAYILLKEQERKKGSWDYGTQCSVCNGTIVPPWKRDIRVNFCPWCGADMRDSYKSEGREVNEKTNVPKLSTRPE